MVKVVVILIQSLKPEMGTELEPFSTIVVLAVETYFQLVWPRFSTKDEGIWNFSCYWLSGVKMPVVPRFLLLQVFQLFLSSQHVWQIPCDGTDWVLALGVFQPKHRQLLWQLLCWLLHHEIWCFLKKSGSFY